MKLLTTICLVFTFALQTALAAQTAQNTPNKYRFFDEKDLASIKESAQRNWGKSIIEKLKADVAAREKFGFNIPEKLATRGQNYVCPDDFFELEVKLDEPKWHRCPKCHKSYQGEYYDAAWRDKYQHTVHPYLINCAFIYAATSDISYAQKVRDVLLKYAKIYPSYPDFAPEFLARPNNGYWGKMFEQWLEECGFLADACPAYELIKPTLTPDECNLIESNFFRKAADMLKTRHDKYNWQAWNNFGRAALGVTLKDDQLIQSALVGKYGFHEQFPTMINKDSWAYELSANYHFFALKAMLYTAYTLRASGINLFDQKFMDMFKNVPNCMYSNMTFPAIGDGGYAKTMGENSELYEIALAKTGDESLKKTLTRIYAKSPRNSKYALLNNFEIIPDTSAFIPASSNFTNSGVATLRDGKNTLSMLYGYSDNDHTHADKLAITYHDGKREILADVGTFSYSTPVYTRWQKKTLSHNTLVVDSKSMNIKNPQAAGVVKSINLGDKNPFIEVECDGLYEGVKITRYSSPKDGGLVDRLSAKSDSEHIYDYVLNFLEKPVFAGKAKNVKFDDKSDMYSFLKNSQARAFKKSLVFTVGKREIRIVNNLQDEMLAIVSDAPEIIGRGKEPIKVYSLIIRTRAKDCDISMFMGKEK